MWWTPAVGLVAGVAVAVLNLILVQGPYFDSLYSRVRYSTYLDHYGGARYDSSRFDTAVISSLLMALLVGLVVLSAGWLAKRPSALRTAGIGAGAVFLVLLAAHIALHDRVYPFPSGGDRSALFYLSLAAWVLVLPVAGVGAGYAVTRRPFAPILGGVGLASVVALGGGLSLLSLPLAGALFGLGLALDLRPRRTALPGPRTAAVPYPSS